jgi:2-methylisocitrate lyase-like PEP mutase family enzyme
MSQNELRSLRMLAPQGADYAVVIAGRTRAVNLTRETAIEWANAYAHLGARIVPMDSLAVAR